MISLATPGPRVTLLLLAVEAVNRPPSIFESHSSRLTLDLTEKRENAYCVKTFLLVDFLKSE